MTANARKPHYMLVDDNRFVVIQLKTANFEGGILAALGFQSEKPGDEGNIIGTGIESAIENGAFALRISYQRTQVARGSATVFCSPLNAKTARAALLSSQYRGKPIVGVRIPRKLCYRY